MSHLNNIRYLADGFTVWTEGLNTSGHPELRACVHDPVLVDKALTMLRYIVAYIREYDVSIGAGETFAYGYWLTKFLAAREDILDIWELDPFASDFVPGVTATVTYWRDQRSICEQASAEFCPPLYNGLAVISEGVLEGAAVQGIRYPSSDHMSGWWITTDQYNGDIDTLKGVHLYHVTAARPDLARYLALPHGFRFTTENGEDFWFDGNVVAEDP